MLKEQEMWFDPKTIIRAFAILAFTSCAVLSQARLVSAQSGHCSLPETALITLGLPSMNQALFVLIVEPKTANAGSVSSVAERLRVLKLNGDSTVSTIKSAIAGSVSDVERAYRQNANTVDVFVIVDSVFEQNGRPKYNSILTANRDSDVDDHAVILFDALPKLPNKPVLVQISSSLHADKVALIVEAMGALVLWPRLTGTDEFLSYVGELTASAHMHEPPSPDTLKRRNELIANCVAARLQK